MVPTLVHDGEVIIESSVINEYLDDVFPEVPLRPHDPLGRARMRAWCQYIEEVPVPSIRYPSFNAYFVPIWRAMSDEKFIEYENSFHSVRFKSSFFCSFTNKWNDFCNTNLCSFFQKPIKTAAVFYK